MSMGRCFASTLLLLAGLFLAGEARAETGTVQEVVFAPGFLAAVDRPTVLRYRYELTGKAMDKPYASAAKLEIREVFPDGRKLAWLDMFDGPNRRRTGPVPMVDQNPLLLAFLQRDTVTMANLTGGAAGYFQQQIRLAFDRPAELEPTTVSWQGRTLEARTVRLRPFSADPSIARFPQFRDKEYLFTVTPEVPGGLWQVRVRLPDTAGVTYLEESLTLDAVE
ncbi:MAG: hypothetical protein NZ555_14910 [Geminicoccaceae bacterium]|nr:hypothetical protein [Geminicoccaceae bacterium]MDW8371922.1 hypothetical protein [Geminicoccaceae bacterium]